MTREEMGKYSVDLFDRGFHCSQAIFAAAMKTLGEGDNENVIASLSPFGGGIASTGNTCGTILGALAVIGYLEGKREPEKRDGRPMWKMSYKLFKGFEEITKEYGGTRCLDIARVDWKDIKAVKAFRKDPQSRRQECFKVIEKTAHLLYDILDQLMEQQKGP